MTRIFGAIPLNVHNEIYNKIDVLLYSKNNFIKFDSFNKDIYDFEDLLINKWKEEGIIVEP